MGTAILPAQDCFGSYNGRQNGLSSSMIYDRVNSLESRCEFGQSKTKAVGIRPDFVSRTRGSQEIARSHDFENSILGLQGLSHSLNFVGSDGLASGESSTVIWPSVSPTVTSANIFILSHQASKPPFLNASKASFGDLPPTSNGRRSLYSNSSTKRFGESMHQPFSMRQSFRDSKCNGMENTVYLEVKGRRASLQEKKPKGHEKVQSESDETGKKNSMRGRWLTSVAKGEVYPAARKDGLLGRKTVEQPGKNIVMEKVTILKRGEAMKSALGKEPDAESRATGGLLNDSDDRDIVQMVETQASNFKNSKSVRASKLVSKVSCDETKIHHADKFMTSYGGSPPKKMGNVVIPSTKCLGPDPSILSKEGSGILGCSSTGTKAPEAIGNGLQMMTEEFQSFSSVESIDYSKVGSPPGSVDIKGSASPVFQLEKWAGPAYSNSPPPSSLPFPKFSMQQARSIAMDLVDAREGSDTVRTHSISAHISAAQENKIHSVGPVTQSCAEFSHFGVDKSATRDLRRLLHLD